MPDSEAGRSQRGAVDDAAGGPGTGSGESTGLLWGVGAVSAKLDIARPTLRTWDRRYGLGPSLRTPGGHRRYTAADVSRMQLMNRLLDTGVAAAQAAQVACTATDDELAVGASPTRTTRRAGNRRRASGTVGTLVRAAKDLQAEELARCVSVQLQRRGAVEAWEHVFAPFLIEIGQQWTLGEFGIASEHLASGVLAAELRAFSMRHRSQRPVAGRVILTCAEDEQHVLPVFAIEAALAEGRIPTLVLGARVPAKVLHRAMVARRPAVVFVWASMAQTADADPPRRFDPQVSPHVLLGGPGWDANAIYPYGGVPVERVVDLGQTVSRIERILQS
ncbi:MAG: MerR family transcriptional regulator [Actinomycetota bacterium]|nr:MerR family transcriptional regulator [Actinomycetota bacterium]